MKTAALIIIGNEILSGRTQDSNVIYCAKRFSELGIRLKEVRMIADVEEDIVHNVNELRKRHDYIITTGGIGPTHDDITAASIARSFNVPLCYHPKALEILEHHYGSNLNDSRRKMGLLPKGANLIENPVSKAPAFYLENVFVLAGVPIIMQAMFEMLVPLLDKGSPIISQTVSCTIPESILANELESIQNHYPTLDIGSYPFLKNGHYGLSLVARGTDQDQINKAVQDLCKMIENFGDKAIIDV